MRAIAWICITFSIATSICLIVKKPSLLTPWIIFLISCVQADLFIFSKNDNSTASPNQNTNDSETVKRKVEETMSFWNVFFIIFLVIAIIVLFFAVNWVDNKTKNISLAKFQ